MFFIIIIYLRFTNIIMIITNVMIMIKLFNLS